MRVFLPRIPESVVLLEPLKFSPRERRGARKRSQWLANDNRLQQTCLTRLFVAIGVVPARFA
jgi:hypothetical protein